MNQIQTHRLDNLYYKFLKPKNISIEKLEDFAKSLHEKSFIVFVYGLSTRYSETEKLTSREHRDELFKIVQSFV